jgi:hypothetical protein
MELNFSKKTFFEAISMADSEKIHSETIAWVFGMDSSILDDGQKSKALTKLYKLPDQNYSGFSSITEEGHVDIIIRTDYPAKTFLIENKLKTSEHLVLKTGKWQTEAYFDVIENDEKDFPNPVGLFLTITGEKAKDSLGRWVDATYGDLAAVLNDLKIDESKREHHILKDYIESIDKLSKVFEHFRQNPKVFPSVFIQKQKKGKKKHLEGYSYNNYVLDQGLETILHKAFLLKASQKIKRNNVYIGETRARASISFRYAKFIIPESNNKITKEYGIGFEFQGGTVKVQVASMEYLLSNKNELSNDFYNAFKDHFEKIPGFSFNSPRSKAYASVSMKIPNFNSLVYDVDLLGAELNNYQNDLWKYTQEYLTRYSYTIEVD